MSISRAKGLNEFKIHSDSSELNPHLELLDPTRTDTSPQW